MPNRTVQILGVAYGSNPTSMTATWSGNQIFSGTVPTQNAPAPTYASSMADINPGLLFTFEIPMDATGNYSMTTSVQNNTVLLAEIKANYCNIGNVVGNTLTWLNGGNIPSSEYGTQFIVQTSSDLVTWDEVAEGDLNNTAGSLSYSVDPASGPAKQFVRLKVTPN